MTYILPILLIVFVIGIGWAGRFLAYHLIKRLSKTSARYVSIVLQVGITIGGSYLIAKYFEIDPTIILALVAIVTAGISLHAGQIIEASIAGAVLLLDGKISVGEQVTVADISGTVVEIGFSNVTIQSNTRGLVTIPSSKIVGDIIINHTRLPALEQSLTFIFYDKHDNDLAIKTIKQALTNQGLSEGSKILHDWVDGSQTYAIVFKTPDYSKRREVSSKLSLELTKAFEDENFPIGSVTFTKAI